MHIREKALQHWLTNFYGYGSWDAKIWFVAYEEGGGDTPEEVEEKFDYFMTAHAGDTAALCDLRQVYRQVAFRTEGPRAEKFASQYDYRFGKNGILHGIWKNLISFTHGFKNKPLPDLYQYQQKSFVTKLEAFIQLYPLPSTHNHAWYYSWLDIPQHSFLRTRKAYEDKVYDERIGTILANIKRHKPEVVLMYDMNNINTLKQSIQSFFPAVQFKMVKAIPLQIPQHHRADFDGTTILITTQTPALKHNRVETGFDWELLGEIARQ